MMDLKRYQFLKADADRRRRDADRAEGALAQVMDRLKKEHGCKTLDAAKGKLAVLRRDREVAEERFKKAVTEFEEEWGDRKPM